jgi:hypothetical protein
MASVLRIAGLLFSTCTSMRGRMSCRPVEFMKECTTSCNMATRLLHYSSYLLVFCLRMIKTIDPTLTGCFNDIESPQNEQKFAAIAKSTCSLNPINIYRGGNGNNRLLGDVP